MMTTATSGTLDNYLAVQAAFNEGCDARRYGWPATANPYPMANESLWLSWRHGWEHYDSEYAADVRGRWPVTPLAAVAA